MDLHKTPLVIGLLLSVCLAAACATSPDSAIDAPQTLSTVQAGVQGFAPPSTLEPVPPPDLRRYLTGMDIDFTLPYNNQWFIPQGVQLEPAWDGITLIDFAGLAYVGYSFDLAGYEGRSRLQLGWYDPPPLKTAWVGLANWGLDRWDWLALPPSANVELDSLEPYLNSEDCLSTIVLATGTTESELHWLRVGDNLKPCANMSGTADIAVLGQPFTLSALSSLDLDGTLALYEWDIDGDGEYELNAGDAAQIEHVFEPAGEYHVGLRVTDDMGATDIDFKDIAVSEGIYDFAGFETGWQGWAPDVADVIVGLGDEIYWEIDLSTKLPFSGTHSVWLTADNRTDACKLWVEKRFSLAPDTAYTVNISYKFASEIGGEIGTWTIIAGAMNADPETGYDIFDQGLNREWTYNGGVPGFTWLDKTYTMDVTTGAAGELYLLAGVWGVFEVWQTYYIDDITVQIVPAG